MSLSLNECSDIAKLSTDFLKNIPVLHYNLATGIVAGVLLQTGGKPSTKLPPGKTRRALTINKNSK